VGLKPRFTDIGRELGAAVARMLTHKMMLPSYPQNDCARGEVLVTFFRPTIEVADDFLWRRDGASCGLSPGALEINFHLTRAELASFVFMGDRIRNQLYRTDSRAGFSQRKLWYEF
jgi:hypothetical protein